MATRSRQWAFVGAGVLFTCALLVGLQQSDWRWQAWQPATCVATSCFTERPREGPIHQPSNTWSNLGFVCMGWMIAGGLVAGSDQDEPAATPLRNPAVRVGYGLLVASLGWTSMWFHASLTLAGEWSDMFSMLMFTSFVVALNLGRATACRWTLVALGYLLVNALFAWITLPDVHAALPLFVALTIGILASDRLVRRRTIIQANGKWLTASIVCCLASFAIWILDRLGLFSSPDSWLQGHALWHIGQAGTTGLLYRYYASERMIEAQA